MSLAKFRTFSAIISVTTFSGSFSFYFVRVPNDINRRSFIIISQFLEAVSVHIFFHHFLNYSKVMPLPKGNQIPMSGQLQYVKSSSFPPIQENSCISWALLGIGSQLNFCSVLLFFPPLFHSCWAQKHFLINIQHINFGIRIWSLEKPTVTLSNNNESDFYPGKTITAKIMLLLFSRNMSVLYQRFYHNILSSTNSIHPSVSLIFHWINFVILLVPSLIN